MKSSQDSLVLEATADGLSGEQTWPTEAEMNVGDSAILETIDSAIGRNRRIIPTNVSHTQIFLHAFIMSTVALDCESTASHIKCPSK
jgi:hypothetical protein